MGKTPSVLLLQKNILLWYSRNRRSLPWRNSRDPYRILLSEIMSQQTQVSRVALYYKHWVKKFPNFSSVANARAADILREWSGLGYNSRALRFHQLAKIIAWEFRSRLPEDTDELQNLPGIGKYTAHAIACFAFGKNVAVVDVNIKRIVTRWTKKIRSASEQLDERTAWKAAEKLLPKKNAIKWNQALMDFGALVCTARKPKCSECIVSSQCASAFSKSFLLEENSKEKKEPEWRGIPRRLYRGNVLKLLHHHSYSVNEITLLLWKEHTQRDISWTTSLLKKMTGDGFLSLHHGKYSIIQ